MPHFLPDIFIYIFYVNKSTFYYQFLSSHFVNTITKHLRTFLIDSDESSIDISVTISFRKVKLLFEMPKNEKTKNFISELHRISEGEYCFVCLYCIIKKKTNLVPQLRGWRCKFLQRRLTNNFKKITT